MSETPRGRSLAPTHLRRDRRTTKDGRCPGTVTDEAHPPPLPDRGAVLLSVVAIGTWLGAWLGATTDGATWLTLTACALGGLCGLGMLMRGGTRAAGVVVLVTALGTTAGALSAYHQRTVVERSAVTALAQGEERVQLTMTVRGDPRPRGQPPQPGQPTHILPAAVTAVDGHRLDHQPRVVVLVSGASWVGLVPSQRVVTKARLVPADRDPLTAALVLPRGTPTAVAAPSPAHQRAGQARAGLRAASSDLPQPVRGLLPAVVVGDRAELDAGISEDFRVTGMTHIMVPSGAKLAIMLGCTLGLARLLRAPVWVQVATGAATIAVFVVVCRPEPSVVRAAVMGGLGLVALGLGRPRAGLSVLAVAVLGTVVVAPDLARSFGFALSVLATGGLLVLAPRWRESWSPWLGRPVAEPVAVALAAQLACYPVLVLLADEVSLIAVPANALATPFVPAATVAGFGVALVAMVSVEAAQWLVWLPAAPVAVLALIAEESAGIPYGTVPWPGGPSGALILALVLTAMVTLRGRWGAPLAAGSLALLLVALTVQVVAPPWPPRSWIMVACDVGQGDGLVLSAGRAGAVVVDAGPDPVTMQRCLRELRVWEVGLLVVTHDHADHTGGVNGVLRHREVTTGLAPPGFASSPTGQLLQRGGVDLHEARPGQRARVGPWRLDVLWPEPEHAPSVNDESVVVRAEWSDPVQPGVTVLLTGDVEEPAQQVLVDRRTPQLDVDVLKTPHHGAGTQVPEFLAATRPRLTVTSLGANNPHGHPTPETWAQLTQLTERNYRTDLHGDIAIVATGDGPVARVRGADAQAP
ncbi:ComEC/Rec2 family competence protein [Lipingzhangella sp. LS1_29]|uniref:ComEC/Rec2 family competence protein n=1 Tax=Lipingzhangella rawalii TaxID=2055835 RepID=A0ABU2H780_9ACTN|nr:ComEC/Rec2 family competence protein [Lipingzhangella rawalii]MDS1271166.1 ComEC/Rec2 family competence protein [Lipingzhangella rawalii]